MKCLEGKTVKSSPPSDCDSRSPRSSDWPSGHSGPSRPADSHSDTAGGRESGPSTDRSTGIVVTLSDGAAVSTWPHDDHSGPSRPADSHSDTAGHGSGPSNDRSTGIVVTLSDGAAISTWPHDGHSGKQLGLGDWYCTQETNFSQMHLPESVAFLVK